MTFYKKTFFAFFCILVSFKISAQQSWGIANSNYAGVSNIDLNPSSMVLSKCSWDVNIASVDASILNNSFYSNPQFVFPLFFKPQISFATSNNTNEARVKSSDIVLNDKIQNFTFLNIGANIKGPSFMYSTGFDAFAITTAFRGGVSSFNLPKSIVQTGYENLDGSALYNNSYNIPKNVEGAAMAWIELGGSYARKLSESSNYVYTGGVSLKLLIGYSGGYALSNGVDYTIPYRANFTATNLNMSYGHSINNEDKPISLSNPLGSGTSVDIGFTMMKKKSKKTSQYYSCPRFSNNKAAAYIVSKNYKWKLGVSMVDLGGINFSTNAAAYTYKNVAYSWDTITRIDVKTLKQVDQLIYNNFSGATSATKSNNFFIWTPTAFSGQFDYNINDVFYANLSIVQRLVISTQPRLARMNTLALTPRYEQPDLEIAMPIILNEYMYPNLGLMVRYKYFFIGSDQLGSTLGLTNLYGINLYFGIKINHLGQVFREPKVSY